MDDMISRITDTPQTSGVVWNDALDAVQNGKFHIAEQTEPQTHDLRTDTHECVKDTHDKTESSSEKPNNCEDEQDWKDRMWAEAIVTEPTISKMEQVDKDINVRSKDEPQTDCPWK